MVLCGHRFMYYNETQVRLILPLYACAMFVTPLLLTNIKFLDIIHRPVFLSKHRPAFV
jgi:hypothetical protein